MKKAPIPKNDLERLQALKEYELLDTPPEKQFDELTKLASLICDTPMALVTLVDKDRLWFKSKQGLEGDECPRDISFCGHAINQDGVMQVKNSLDDERFVDNPMVKDSTPVLFYAGSPLITPEGYSIGTLCVFGDKPKELSEFQMKALQILSRQVVAQMEIIRKARVISEKAQQLVTREEQLIHGEKMASLGTMAGGIAHEINNPLAIIKLSTYRLKTETSKNPDQIDWKRIKNASQKIDDTTDRISRIVRGLKSVSRDSSHDDLEEFSFQEIVEDVLDVLNEKFFSKGVQLSVEGNIDFRLMCRPSEISQILINLLGNAHDAILDGKSDEKWAKVSVETTEESHIIRVIDSGPKITEEIKNKIMDPFFTTKPVGKGTGLGLSISKGIAERHSGFLQLNIDKENTCFELYLPKSDQKNKNKSA
ncbi:MAG: ATP-binding protein [Bdellovibrionales bacterium]